jgi:UDP-N-acetylmuramate--alanine ligase
MKIYCSGIGGIGLSAYAAYQAASGHTVMGSDRADSPLLDDLRSQGIEIFLDQSGTHIPSDCNLFVYSEAIPADAPERVRARDFGIPSQSYFHALGELSQPSFVIAVCGTHGKSSTTAMVAKMLIDAGKDPSVIVGTKMKELDPSSGSGRNWRKGGSDIFVVEACEYRRSFHYLSPDIALMTNVDGDHFDAFSSIDEYQEAFITFLKRLPGEGAVITHGLDEDCAMVAQESGKRVIDADGIKTVKVGVPGDHMKANARLVLALAKHLHIDQAVAKKSLAEFHGTWRRMEVKGELPNGATVIDDYAHHPVEIRATLSATKEAYPERRIVAVFQPHTHDRTQKLYNEFCNAFGDAALVIIPDIYVARSDIETQIIDVDSFVADIANRSGCECLNGSGLDNTLTLLQSRMQPGDVIIVMGAGTVTKLADRLLQ